MPRRIRPKRSSGSCSLIRLPHGLVASTWSLPGVNSKSLSSSSPRTFLSRLTSPSRSGITSPTRPRRRCGSPVGKWNWLRPILTHMLLVLVIR